MKNKTYQTNKFNIMKYYKSFHGVFYGAAYRCNDVTVCTEDDRIILNRGDRSCDLLSETDPTRGFRDVFLKNADKGKDTVYVVFGLGMGELVDYVKENNIEFKKILIVEPYNNVLDQLFAYRDFLTLFDLKKLHIAVFSSAQGMADHIIDNVKREKNIVFIHDLSYSIIYEDFLAEAEQLMNKTINSLRISTATVAHFINKWTRNQIKSIGHNNDLDVRELYGKYAGKPAIIVSAGPSLEKNGHLLVELAGKALILAPGSGAKILKKKGLPFHMAVATDADYEEVELMSCLEETDVLLCTRRMDEEVRELKCKKIYFTLADEYLYLYYLAKMKTTYGVISDYSSVSSCAIEIAAMLGCNPIVLIGQDLSFTDNNMYAFDAADGEKLLGAIGMVDVNGNKVKTDKGYIAIKCDIEKQAEMMRSKGISIVNATEGGLSLSGIENRKLGEYFADFNLQDDISPNILPDRIVERYFKPEIVVEIVNELSELIDRMTAYFDLVTFAKKKIEINNSKQQTDRLVKEIEWKEQDILKEKIYGDVISPSFGNIQSYFAMAENYLSRSAEKDNALARIKIRLNLMQQASNLAQLMKIELTTLLIKTGD